MKLLNKSYSSKSSKISNIAIGIISSKMTVTMAGTLIYKRGICRMIWTARTMPRKKIIEPETKVFKTKAKMRRASIPWLAAFVLATWFRLEALSISYLRILLVIGCFWIWTDFPSSVEKKT